MKNTICASFANSSNVKGFLLEVQFILLAELMIVLADLHVGGDPCQMPLSHPRECPLP